ncbi:MAG: HTH-type transcriptional repressor CzrA [Cellvibrionales bacterium UBA7375]|nr:ArsR family transcriptional regulator [Gammaproteobacteria bacterium]CAI8167381.1 MAG: HTH-type transcriptional repressor CzrA [Cellvibrionales bacterium UBA7375]
MDNNCCDKIIQMTANSSVTSTFDQTAPQAVGAIGILCKAAGDPLRIQILKVLQQNAYGVLELCQVFDIRQSAMSHHLKILSNAGLVSSRREGTTIFYRRNPLNPDIDLQTMQKALFQAIDKAAVDADVAVRLADINTERASASVEFFNRNVSLFEENQDLIASWSDYGDSVESLLESSISATKQALEIGPGYGQFLKKLCATFEQVIALDNSTEMLDQCAQRVKKQSLNNISFLHGDTFLALNKNIRADFVSLNMVLHHNPIPGDIIRHCADLLTDNGVLLITDLCAHDQDWVKQACGDLWLGFDPSEITDWAEIAGLTEGNSLFLTQRNGFRIQLRQFKKAATTN